MSDFRQRLEKYLKEHGMQFSVEQLTPDASTREYFRLKDIDKSLIACIYPQDEFGSNQLNACIDVTEVFLSGGLPVARIEAADRDAGIIIHEDFGDNILRNVMRESTPEKREQLRDKAIAMIADIQAATPKAFELNSIASKLKFDEEKLTWELNFFKTHYFESLKKSPLSESDDAAINLEFAQLSRGLESRANVLCHRDFHAANIMVDKSGNLRIIDHQDARLGSVAYDLVSLLLDRVTEARTDEWLKHKKKLFLRYREEAGLSKMDYADFDYEFQLMTVQRCLKAIGTFSNQAANRRKTEYIEYIKPMFSIVLNACRNLECFPGLLKVIEEELNS